MFDDGESSISLKPRLFEPKALDSLSIDDMRAYVGCLEHEIDRVREIIAAREHARAGAEKLFRG